MGTTKYTSKAKPLSSLETASIDANFGPWASIEAYEAWLAETGIDSPLPGMRIAVLEQSGKITCYIWEVKSDVGAWRQDGGMTDEEKAQLAELASRFELDELNERLLVYGDPQDESSETDTRKKYFVPLTELAKPNAPTITVTDYKVVVDGTHRKAVITVTNNTPGAIMEYSLGDHVIDRQWYSTTGTIEIDPDFSNNGHTAVLPYSNVLKLRATKYGVKSDINSYTINIQPKVATPTIVITRSPNDNDWATSASAVITPSATAGANSVYSDDFGDDLISFDEVTTLVAHGDAGEIRLSATKNGFANSDEYISPAFVLNKKKAYYGFSTASSLSSESNVSALASTGGSQEATKLSGALTITPTGVTAGYVWLCCTDTLNKDSIVPNQYDVIPFGFENAITVGDYKCYRSTNTINPETTNVYIP